MARIGVRLREERLPPQQLIDLARRPRRHQRLCPRLYGEPQRAWGRAAACGSRGYAPRTPGHGTMQRHRKDGRSPGAEVGAHEPDREAARPHGSMRLDRPLRPVR